MAAADDLHQSGPGRDPDQSATVDAPSPPAITGEATVRFHVRPTLADYVRLNAAILRQTRVVLAFSGFVVGSGVVTLVAGEVVGVVSLLFGLSLASGYFAAPFVWFSLRRRADLLLAGIDVVADETGLTQTRPTTTTASAWSVYRRVRETRDAFLLDFGMGASGFVLKRGVDPPELAKFRALLERVGFDLHAPPPRRFLVSAAAAFVLGALVTPGFTYLPRVVATLQANATISLSTEVNGRKITVYGSSDLPDGSTVTVEIVQLDQWNRAEAAGAIPDPTNSEWVVSEDVTVGGRSFAASFDVPSWPAGQAVAVADFWMYADQPAAAVNLYGPTGLSMRGPDVVSTGDGGQMLEVQTSFHLP